MHLILVEGLKVTTIRSLTDDEYQQYSQSTRLLYNVEQSFHAIGMVVVNEQEFQSEMRSAFDEYRELGLTAMSLNRYTFAANRRLLNYLTAVRFFLDFAQARVQSRFGKQSNEMLEFKEACKQAFDDVFAYRFLYKLRNFAQHAA